MTPPLDQLAGFGVVGVMLMISLYALRALYTELGAERAARIQDAKDGMTLLLAVQKEVLAAVDKLTDIYGMVQEERRQEKARRPEQR